MKMRSSIIAMLWENWRLTRAEAAQRLGIGIVAASAALVLFDASVNVAFWILLFTHSIIWMSIAKLSGGRFLDGYKPGFPLHLLYTRPVPTTLFVGVAAAYDAISCTALYLVSAALLGLVFGQPLPLLTVAVWLVTFHLVYTAIQWSTRSRVIQWIGSIFICLPLYVLLKSRVTSPLQVEFSLAENAGMALVGIGAFALTVRGVARQRRGDSVATVPRARKPDGYPDWLVALFRLPCPTSSATRAQVWFDLRTSALPVLAIGLGLAMLVPLLFLISIPVEPVRPFAIFGAMISMPLVLVFGGNAFGIRSRQGHALVGAFESTQPYGTAQFAGLKVLLRTACVLAALVAVGASVWASSALLHAWEPWVMDGKPALPGLLRLRREVGDAIGGMSGYALIALAVLACIAVAIMVASRAAFTALRAIYTRRVYIAGSLLLLYGLALILLALATRSGFGLEALTGALFRATPWLALAAAVLVTVYLYWKSLAEGLLTLRQLCGAILISVVFVAAGVMLEGGQSEGISATEAVQSFAPALLPLMAAVLAPWSLSRIRHM